MTAMPPPPPRPNGPRAMDDAPAKNKGDHLVDLAQELAAQRSSGNGLAAARFVPQGELEHEPTPPGRWHDAKARIRPAELTKLRDLKMEKIDWIWAGWIARGEVCLIAGVPEAGKTTCALSISAIFSSGGRWPDETLAKAGNIIIWTGEDTAKTVIGPRLVQMGADIDRVHIITGQRDEDGKMRPFNPSRDLPGLTLAAKELPGGCDLLIIDPIVAAIGGKR